MCCVKHALFYSHDTVQASCSARRGDQRPKQTGNRSRAEEARGTHAATRSTGIEWHGRGLRPGLSPAACSPRLARAPAWTEPDRGAGAQSSSSARKRLTAARSPVCSSVETSSTSCALPSQGDTSACGGREAHAGRQGAGLTQGDRRHLQAPRGAPGCAAPCALPHCLWHTARQHTAEQHTARQAGRRQGSAPWAAAAAEGRRPAARRPAPGSACRSAGRRAGSVQGYRWAGCRSAAGTGTALSCVPAPTHPPTHTSLTRPPLPTQACAPAGSTGGACGPRRPCRRASSRNSGWGGGQGREGR